MSRRRAVRKAAFAVNAAAVGALVTTVAVRTNDARATLSAGVLGTVLLLNLQPRIGKEH